VWISTNAGITEKSPLGSLWQLVQLDVLATGIWLAGFTGVLKYAKLVLWQFTQSPLAGCFASKIMNVPALALGRVWNPVYCAVALVDTVAGFNGY